MKTKELKIYKDTIEFSRLIHLLIKNFPRFEKYSIGAKLLNESLDLIHYIFHVNKDSKNRENQFNEFMNQFEVIQALLRISFEEKLIPTKWMKPLIEKISTIEEEIKTLNDAN